MKIPKQIKQAVGLAEEFYFGMDSQAACPIGCDSRRTGIAISKPGRKHDKKFVPVYYKKKLTEFQQSDNISVS